MNEAELLFTSILDCDRASLYLNKTNLLDKKESFFVSSVLKRRISFEPIQYILGKTEFMGLEFKVNRDVLIPRPETEILVETALKLISGVECRVSGVLDLGTGSGCIAISLAKLFKNVKITATDISKEALEVAKENALLNNVSEKIQFVQSDLFAARGLEEAGYDIIVSNPPYVVSREIQTLQPEINYEPRIALDGGKDGLSFYRRIIQEAPAYLKPGGFLIMEMGVGQYGAIKNIFQIPEIFEIIDVVRDYNNIERVIIAQYKAV